MDKLSKEERRKRIIVQSSAGVAASFCQHLLHPFDLIKVRLQSHDSGRNEQNVIPRYRSLVESFKNIYRQEGVRGFYKGMVLSIVASNISYGIFFALYEVFKQKLSSQIKNNLALDISASAAAAAASSALAQPLFVLKTRRLLDQKSGLGASRIADLSKQVWQQHGFLGFYRGYSLSFALGLYGVIQLSSYKYLKNRFDLIYGLHQTPNWVIAMSGVISRLISSLILHPLTTVRTRFQQNQFVEADLLHQKYNTITEIVKRTYKYEGIKGFYKGVIPMTLRTLPSQGLFFLVYENTKNYMSNKLEMNHIK